MFGPAEDEQVGEAGDRRAAVCLAGCPFQTSVRLLPSRPWTIFGARHPGDVEAGAEDDRVDLALGAVGADDGVAAHLGEALGEQLDVGLGDRRVEVVGDQGALAAERVVGRELAAQLRIRDLAGDVALADARGARISRGSLMNAEREQPRAPSRCSRG